MFGWHHYPLPRPLALWFRRAKLFRPLVKRRNYRPLPGSNAEVCGKLAANVPKLPTVKKKKNVRLECLLVKRL